MWKNGMIIICMGLTILSMGAAAFAAPDDAPPPGKNLKVYHLGNSLTRNIPVERLQKLFERSGGSYDYGIQLGGGHQLDQHLSKRNHGNAPGKGKYNLKDPYGEYDNAFRNYKWDAIVMQPYNSELDKEIQITKGWPYYEAGAIQAASEFIDYARAKTKPGDDAWHKQHPNTENVATDRFYIYATWPKAEQILEQEGEKTFAHFYYQDFEGGSQHCKQYFETLVSELNKRHPDLPVPVRLIPAGEVMAELDKKIRNGSLPGIKEFYDRNQAYYIKSRRNNKGKSPYDPDQFDASKGALNFYADGVHMNDQPHNGKDSGTLGSYIAAATIYTVLSGENPVGLTVEPYEMFDAEKDAALIRAIQQTIWDVVKANPQTGVSGK
ncbi:MAG: hypothetical protein ACLFQ6_07855 [Candidatus Sumerlaeia bacterium]